MSSWAKLSLFVAVAAALSPSVAGLRQGPATKARHFGRATANPNKSVIVQMFQWNWDSIAAECTNFLGPAGYGYVQVNPPQESVTGDQWWTDYQAVSYQLTSKHGNRDQFANMVQTCHAAGVGVLVDTLWNHMSGFDNGQGTAGSSFSHYNYPGIWQDSDFHSCRHGINDWNSAYEIQNCELSGLADLASENDNVRSRLAAFGNDLLSLGVDGFRLDAAKHMPVGDISNILSRLNKNGKSLYITQEVVYGGGVSPNDYTQTGDVQEFRFMNAVRDVFLNGAKLSDLKDLDNRGWVVGSQANIFVANHDSERTPGTLTLNAPSNAYVLASILSIAHPYGTPTVLSSYSFSNNDAGPPNGGYGSCSGSGGANGWLCQHRWQDIAGMTGFRNAVGSAPMNHWVAPDAQRVAFGRGSAGFVAINNEDSVWTATFKTSLPDGTYCDVIKGGSSNGQCTGSSFTVSGGSFKATVPQRGAIAIHTNAKRA